MNQGRTCQGAPAAGPHKSGGHILLVGAPTHFDIACELCLQPQGIENVFRRRRTSPIFPRGIALPGPTGHNCIDFCDQPNTYQLLSRNCSRRKFCSLREPPVRIPCRPKHCVIQLSRCVLCYSFGCESDSHPDAANVVVCDNDRTLASLYCPRKATHADKQHALQVDDVSSLPSCFQRLQKPPGKLCFRAK